MQTRLTQPTDFLILGSLSDGRRNTAVNIAEKIDKDRAYVNTRLPLLVDYGLIKKIGPVKSSGLYQITTRGVAASQNQSLYSQDREEFETVVDELSRELKITEPQILRVTEEA